MNSEESIENKIVFKATENSVELEVRLENETVWLTQKQMSKLFNKSRKTITEHISTIYSEKELEKDSVSRNFQLTAADGKSYNTIHYNLDMIISVGYRVNSKKGTQFRIWATNTLRNYLVKGYAINQKRLETDAKKYEELQVHLQTLKRVYENETIGEVEAKGLIKVITDYSKGLELLDKYDQGKLEVSKEQNQGKGINYEDALNDISSLRERLKLGELFGKERDSSFNSSLRTIFQTFDTVDLYPSIEEKAANLLYLIVKNHSFVDGNKRIGVFMFVRFLDLNSILYSIDGKKAIEENTLVALALMIAQSDPKNKDILVKLVANLIH